MDGLVRHTTCMWNILPLWNQIRRGETNKLLPLHDKKIWKRKNSMSRNDNFSIFILKTKVTCDKGLLPVHMITSSFFAPDHCRNTSWNKLLPFQTPSNNAITKQNHRLTNKIDTGSWELTPHTKSCSVAIPSDACQCGRQTAWMWLFKYDDSDKSLPTMTWPLVLIHVLVVVNEIALIF